MEIKEVEKHILTDRETCPWVDGKKCRRFQARPPSAPMAEPGH